MNIQSQNISIFPIGSGRDDIKDARLLNEKNLTGIFKALTSKDSYVVSYIDRKMSFVLGGYYIECIIPTDANWTNDLYAYMTLENDHIKTNLDVQSGDFKVYKGVEFVTSEPQSGYTYKLKLLSSGVVPTESLFKHSGSSLFLNYNDGETTAEKSAEEYINIYLKKVLGEDVLNADPETTLSEGLAKTYIDTYVDSVFGDTYDPEDTSTLGGIVGEYVDSVFGEDFDPNNPSSELGGIIGSTVDYVFDEIVEDEIVYYFGGTNSSGDDVPGLVPEKFTELSGDVEEYFGNDEPVGSADYVQGTVPQKYHYYFHEEEGVIPIAVDTYFGTTAITEEVTEKGFVRDELERYLDAYRENLRWKEYPSES